MDPGRSGHSGGLLRVGPHCEVRCGLDHLDLPCSVGDGPSSKGKGHLKLTVRPLALDPADGQVRPITVDPADAHVRPLADDLAEAELRELRNGLCEAQRALPSMRSALGVAGVQRAIAEFEQQIRLRVLPSLGRGER